MQLELFRLSLLPRPQSDIFEDRRPDGSSFTREEWLRTTFAKSIEFVHRKKRFLFLPNTNIESGDVIAGGLGRKVRFREDVPTSAGFQPKEHDGWQSVVFLLDPSTHADGQMIAIEEAADIGKPLAILASLVNHLNSQRPPPPFLIELGVISEPSDFWGFVEKHEGEITTASFEFIAPNMFGMHTDYDEEMKALQANEHVEHATLRLKSTQGLNLKTAKVEQAIDYISRGTGTVKAKTRRGAKFNSNDSVKRVSVPDEEGPLNPPKTLPQRIALALRIVFSK